jgi:ubiquinone/menaquinone biosynthesis C-methylase UbiE
MGQRTFDDFDEFANNYRDIHTKNLKLAGADSFYFAEMKVQMLRPFENNKSLQVLDIGCGDGTTELFMQRYFSHWRLTGIDVSEGSINAAKEKNLPGVSFSIYNGTAIPFADESVDVVFVAGVLHHVEFSLHDELIKEIARVLKRGGRLHVFEHNPLNPLTRYLVNTCVFDANARLLRCNYTIQLLRQNEFQIKNKQFIIFFPRKKIFSPFIFLEKYLQWLPLGGQYFIRALK